MAFEETEGSISIKKNAEVLKQWYDILNIKKLVITDSTDFIDPMNSALEEEKIFVLKYSIALPSPFNMNEI